jgi:AraC-like DNA-binding protein
LEKIFNLVSFIGAVQGVLLAVAFATRKNTHLSTKALAAYIFIFSIGLLEPFLEGALTGWIRSTVSDFLAISNFLYGPLLYLFVFYLTSMDPYVSKRHFFHLVPFFLLLLTDFSFSLLGIDLLLIDIVRLVVFELLIVQILTYNVMAIRRLSEHGQLVVDVYSNLVAGDLKWLKSLLIVITAIYILSFAISHFLVFGLESARDFYILVQLSITVTIYMMSYRLILQPELFIPQPNVSVRTETHDVPFRKYSKSGLKPQQADEYLRLLSACMLKDKPYLDPNLTIYTLSEKLSISRNHLTQVINEKLDKNFYTFINGHRVEEAKKMLLDPKLSHLSLAGIGYEAGFKSKTSFNINFKKFTGLTPGEWKKVPVHKTLA